LQGELSLNEQIYQACKELIDDAKNGCADLVFKEICLEILSRASKVLTKQQFKKLASYAAQRMREEMPFEVREQELAWNR
jgi:ubiquinone biosynthesis protein UbiJ